MYPQQFNCTFVHSLNGRKFYKIEDILGARDLIAKTWVGADPFVLIIGGNDVADVPGCAKEFAQNLLGLAF